MAMTHLHRLEAESIHILREVVAAGINPFDHGWALHTDIWKTQGLKQVLDAAFGSSR